MDSIEQFKHERQKNIEDLGQDIELQRAGLHLLQDAARHNYSFNFDWLSRPIIQHPQDIVAFQEIVWKVKPDLIIETGIAHGGSLILSASLLALLDLCENGNASLSPSPQNPRRVVAVDIDIREHNRECLVQHPLYPRLTLIEGSSIDQKIIDKVKKETEGHERVLVCLDSNHTHQHVLAELESYAPLVTKGSYCIIWDTVIEDMPKEMLDDRPWGPSNSPKSAVREYLKSHPEFVIDKQIQDKLLMTVAPDGFLKRAK
jgi:cephalosporin hydroxylase